MKKVLVFDLDGTLLNTIYDIADAMNYALTKFHLPTNSDSDYVSYIGDGIYELTRRAIHNEAIAEETIQKVLHLYDETYHQKNCCRTALFPLMKETLLELKKRGYTLAVISNKPDFDSNVILNHYLKDVFVYQVGSKDHVLRKPATEAMDILCNSLGVSKNDVVYFGDSHVDAEFAINVGCPYFLFEHGYEKKERLHSYQPVAFLKNASEILDYFK